MGYLANLSALLHVISLKVLAIRFLQLLLLEALLQVSPLVAYNVGLGASEHLLIHGFLQRQPALQQRNVVLPLLIHAMFLQDDWQCLLQPIQPNQEEMSKYDF